jgi:hypothetical protein
MSNDEIMIRALGLCDRFTEWILDETLDIVRSPFNASSRLYWVFLLSASIWEWMFGNLVLPSEEIRKNLILGVGIGAPQHHPTLPEVYLEPSVSMYEILTRRFQSTRLTP